MEHAEVVVCAEDHDEFVAKLMSECDAFLGCMAWFTNHKILQEAHGKNLGTVINNTVYKDRYVQNFIERHYNDLTYPFDRPMLIRGFDPGCFVDKLQPLGQVRSVGTRHISGMPLNEDLMHCKFLVFGTVEVASRHFTDPSSMCAGSSDQDPAVFVPYGYITGSFNCSKKKNTDSLTYIHGHAAACQMLEQWSKLYHLESQPYGT
jgi:hypothetical protein